MKKRTSVLILSLIVAFVFMSGGYSFWEKKLTIKGKIEVVEPESETEKPQEPSVIVPSTENEGSGEKDEDNSKVTPDQNKTEE